MKDRAEAFVKSVTLCHDQQTVDNIAKACRVLGITEEQFYQQAVLFYVAVIQLKDEGAEFRVWTEGRYHELLVPPKEQERAALAAPA